MSNLVSGLLWSTLAFCIIAILSYFYSFRNKDRRKEVKNMLKIMIVVWLMSLVTIVIIFGAQ